MVISFMSTLFVGFVSILYSDVVIFIVVIIVVVLFGCLLRSSSASFCSPFQTNVQLSSVRSIQCVFSYNFFLNQCSAVDAQTCEHTKHIYSKRYNVTANARLLSYTELVCTCCCLLQFVLPLSRSRLSCTLPESNQF